MTSNLNWCVLNLGLKWQNLSSVVESWSSDHSHRYSCEGLSLAHWFYLWIIKKFILAVVLNLFFELIVKLLLLAVADAVKLRMHVRINVFFILNQISIHQNHHFFIRWGWNWEDLLILDMCQGLLMILWWEHFTRCGEARKFKKFANLLKFKFKSIINLINSLCIISLIRLNIIYKFHIKFDSIMNFSIVPIIFSTFSKITVFKLSISILH